MPGTDDPYQFFFTSSVAQQRDNFCLTGWMRYVGWPRLKIASLSLPEKTKKTQMISGSPAEAAKELVRRLREEARVI